jgi:hypothetical protein
MGELEAQEGRIDQDESPQLDLKPVSIFLYDVSTLPKKKGRTFQ